MGSNDAAKTRLCKIKGDAHFHAIYGEFDVSIAIEKLNILEGELPQRALGMVLEWGKKHQEELRLAWLDAVEMRPIRKIAPLI